MSEAQLGTLPQLSGPLTWKQICECYPDEWIALVEIDWVNDTDCDFRSACVAGHGKRRQEPMVQAEPLPSGSRASSDCAPSSKLAADRIGELQNVGFRHRFLRQ
jgi:hypothetical protein